MMEMKVNWFFFAWFCVFKNIFIFCYRKHYFDYVIYNIKTKQKRKIKCSWKFIRYTNFLFGKKEKSNWFEFSFHTTNHFAFWIFFVLFWKSFLFWKNLKKRKKWIWSEFDWATKEEYCIHFMENSGICSFKKKFCYEKKIIKNLVKKFKKIVRLLIAMNFSKKSSKMPKL